MTVHPCENAEPIPGYLLKERVGVGGYGEVWKVSAPGGLTKAIKFVYGRMDDERAAANSRRSAESRRSGIRSCCPWNASTCWTASSSSSPNWPT